MRRFSIMHKPLFTIKEFEAAWNDWGANCGPTAISVICNKPLNYVRNHIDKFDERRYVNPKMMVKTLDSMGIDYHVTERNTWPSYGLARIQWCGPWTENGVPEFRKWRHTHWVGANSQNSDNIGIFDINAIRNETGWCSLDDWKNYIIPYIIDTCEPECNGKWHITHSIEIKI